MHKINDDVDNLKQKISNYYSDRKKDKIKNIEDCDEIIDNFKKFIEDYKLIIIDNGYTELYLKDIDNKKEYINDYLNIPYTENMIDELIKKYNLEPSNYIVDLLFESMINESNNKL